VRPSSSPYQASTGADVISNAIAAQLKARFDALSEPPNHSIDILLQRLIAQEIEREAGNSNERVP
jgi:hypothetical protein